MVEQIVLEIDNDKIPDDEFKKISENFRNSIIDGLSPEVEFVDRPGPEVMKIRAVITGLDTSSPVPSQPGNPTTNQDGELQW